MEKKRELKGMDRKTKLDENENKWMEGMMDGRNDGWKE